MPVSQRIDPLLLPNLPSKSSFNSLVSHGSQEEYFNTIQRELRKKSSNDNLLENVVSLKDPDRFLLAMRKLRESIVATSRRDDFTIRAYKFMIRFSILLGHWASYRPALLSMHVRDEGFHDLVILDSVRHNAHGAWRLGPTGKTKTLLLSLARRDWVSFSRAYSRCDTYQRLVLGNPIEQHTVQCLTKLYFTAERPFVEKACGRSFDELKKMNDSWEVDADDNVVLKRRRRPAPA